jgi:hypothetical protein
MAINRNSEFLACGDAIFGLFLAGAVLALLLSKADRFSENLVVSCFLFLSYVSLLLLSKDLDNPFRQDVAS